MARDLTRGVTAIVLAAGKGRRLGCRCTKPLVRIAGKPIVLYSLQVFQRCSQVRDIVVVVNPRNKRQISAVVRTHGITKIRAIVRGGARRQDSVARGLAAIDPECRYVLIHDAARPFVSEALVRRLVRMVRSTGAAIAGVPVTSTIKKITRTQGHKDTRTQVEKTLDRSELWEAQTPQAFRTDLILPACRRFGYARVTDDAALMEKSGHPVAMVMGSYANIKITTPEDLRVAETLARSRRAR